MVRLAVLLGSLVSWISKLTHVGAGATWPGEIALRISPEILSSLSRNMRKGIILVAGTNGKTTTTLMIKRILEANGDTVIHNASGANLLNGIVSALLTRESVDWGVFEVDENALPRVLQCIPNPKVIILLNLFRDQLDRYGEVRAVAEKWQVTLSRVSKQTQLIINADDPQLAFIGKNMTHPVVRDFGLSDPSYYISRMQHATDSIYCPSCGNRLTFAGVYYSHLGDWKCTKCRFTHPDLLWTSRDVVSPLEGIYNIYNSLAALSAGISVGIPTQSIRASLAGFKPAFGRMEELMYQGKHITILLSKNPTGFNESLRTVCSSGKKGPMIILLNDRIPDGTDVSWIWDVDFEILDGYGYPVILSGDRAYDMGVRMKYTRNSKLEAPLGLSSGRRRSSNKYQKFEVEKDLPKALQLAVEKTHDKERLWVLATYSAMLDARKILTGKKIL